MRRTVWTLLLGVVALGGTAATVLMPGWFGGPQRGGATIDEKRISVEHVRRTTDKPFDEVARAIERQLGRFEEGVYNSLTADGDVEQVRAKLEAMVGPSGFMLFRTADHGALLRLVGQKRKVIQYTIGNPLYAVRMTQHDVRSSLYAPLRVLLYQDEHGRTVLEYDLPSTLFGQFGNDKVNETATMLDHKLEALATEALGS
jgi:uncharacterized protein (DUF302 family)